MKVQRLKSQSSSGIEQELFKKMRSAFSESDIVRLNNAVRLCIERKLGTPLTAEDIKSLAKRTGEANVAARICADVSTTKERQSYMTLAVACFGLVSAMLKKRGTIEPKVHIVLGSYFLNRFLNDADNMLALAIKPKANILPTMIKLFISWWSTLPSSVFTMNTDPKSESASGRVTFKQDKRFGSGRECQRFLIFKNGTELGCIRWDAAKGQVAQSQYGWVATLFDGFDVTSFRSGKNDTGEPYTAVHKSEVKLHNPTRLSLDLSKVWVRNALRSL